MGRNNIPLIYCIENIVNNKKYIGLSSHGNSRLAAHKLSLKKKNHFNSYLQDSWNKYGEENFSFYVLKICDNHDELSKWEKFYIKKFKTTEKEYGYNLMSGGKNYNHSEETIEKIRNSHIGKIHTEESKKKISDNSFHKGKFGKDSFAYERSHTEEVKDKMRTMFSRNGSPVFGKKYKSSKSKYYGVSIYNQTQKNGSIKTYWRTQLRLDGKQIVLGYFKNEEDAAKRYNEFIIENNLLNPLNIFNI